MLEHILCTHCAHQRCFRCYSERCSLLNQSYPSCFRATPKPPTCAVQSFLYRSMLSLLQFKHISLLVCSVEDSHWLWPQILTNVFFSFLKLTDLNPLGCVICQILNLKHFIYDHTFALQLIKALQHCTLWACVTQANLQVLEILVFLLTFF